MSRRVRSKLHKPANVSGRARLIRWLLVVLWAGMIWTLSSLPDLSSGLEQDFVLRKIAHGVEFGVLTLLLIWALPRPHGKALSLIGAAILALEYAAIDEIHQGFVPGRGPSIRDVGIDAIGIAAALVLWLVVVGVRAGLGKQSSPRKKSRAS